MILMRKITMFEKQVRGHSKSMYTARRKGRGWSTLKTYDNMQGEGGGGGSGKAFVHYIKISYMLVISTLILA